jgi:hypothetical protein
MAKCKKWRKAVMLKKIKSKFYRPSHFAKNSSKSKPDGLLQLFLKNRNMNFLLLYYDYLASRLEKQFLFSVPALQDFALWDAGHLNHSPPVGASLVAMVR